MQEDLHFVQEKNPTTTCQPTNQTNKQKKTTVKKPPLFNCHSLLWAEARVLGKVLAEYFKVLKYKLVK